jgi:hypothetical protein
MKQIQANLIHALTNLHVSIPVAGAVGFAIAAVVWPKYATEINTIAGILASYGIIAAANTPANSQTPKT